MSTTKEQAQREYQELAAKVGDLYFAIEGQESVLRQMKAQMSEYHKQRDAIQAAYLDSLKEAPAASESPSDASGSPA